MRRSLLGIVGGFVSLSACGDDREARPVVETSVELPLLASEDPTRPRNHSREVTIAARDGTVAVSSIHEQFPSADSYEGMLTRRVAINVSRDHGATYEAAVDPTPQIADETADPVVTANGDTFVLSTLRLSGDAVVATSTDGTSWTTLADDLAVLDKPWHAVDPATAEIYVAGVTGYYRLERSGRVLGSVVLAADDPKARQMVNAFADEQGAHFGTLTADVMQWDGVGDPQLEKAAHDVGTEANEYTAVAWSRGTWSRGTWSVHARRSDGLGSIVLAVEQDGSSSEATISEAGANAFLPAATSDDDGRLHVVWYDSAGNTGVLRYARSRGAAPFDDGFAPSVIVDANATPGGFYPFYDTPAGGRRLREYIGIAVDGDVVHVAWTHAPMPPSRVHAAAIRWR